MKIFYYIKKGIPIQYNNFVSVTPVPGLKFTNCYDNKSQRFFWYVIFSFGFLVALAVNLKFWYQYQFLSVLSVYADLEQGVELAFPSVHLCLRKPFNPEKLTKYRKDFLKSNFTMPIEDIDSNLQHLFRIQRAALNFSRKYDDSLEDNIDLVLLQRTLEKLFYEVDGLFKDCVLQGIQTDCNEIFKPVETALGRCFVFNSIYTDDNLHEDPHQVPYLKISELDEDWSLRFKILNKSDNFLLMYLKHPHSPLKLTDYPTFVWYPIKQISDYGFSIMEHMCEEKFRTLVLGYRPCLFPDDAFLDPDLKSEFQSNFYEVGLCLKHCHAMEFLRLCNCLPISAEIIFPKLANKTKICGLREMGCYENNYLAVRQMKCFECYGNCNGALYYVDDELHDLPEMGEMVFSQPSSDTSLNLDYFELKLYLNYWPPVHFHIINIFSTTEFILSLASTASLFLGISILTFVEVFYNLFIRFPFFYLINREYFFKAVEEQEEIDKKKPIPCINMSLKLIGNRN